MPQQAGSKIFIHSISLFFFLCSLIWMGVNYFNKAWITVSKEGVDGVFERGLHHDCYNSTEGINCHGWDWEYASESAFPVPFSRPTDAGFFNHATVWVARGLLFVGLVWLGVTFTCCCFWQNCKENMKKNLRLLFTVQIAGVALFFLLAFVMAISRFSGNVFEKLPDGYTVSCGSGFWHFFLGGLICYLIGSAAFFSEQILEKRNQYRQRSGHQAGIPLNDTSKV